MKEIVVNYNTGRHVSENGQSLALLLDQLLQEIPGFYRKLHIVAHSMGGLVARSALYQAEMSGMAFLTFVDKVFFLATPHRGAILEKGVQLSRILLQAAHYLPFRYTGLGVKKLCQNIPVGEGSSLAPLGEIADFLFERFPHSTSISRTAFWT